LEVKATGAWLAPETETAESDVFDTSFCAVRPVAELEPEVAAVTPVELGEVPPGVGARATLTPDFELAAPESCTVVECWLSTDRLPFPPPTTPELSCVLVVLVSAAPAEAVLAPLRAVVAESGLAEAVAVVTTALGEAAARAVGDALLEPSRAADAESELAATAGALAGEAAVGAPALAEGLAAGEATVLAGLADGLDEGAARGVAAVAAGAGVVGLASVSAVLPWRAGVCEPP
jgi:hypothetical protein